jgi:prepilin-type N-terminal cleavage/methylation domain-containing protein
VGPDRRELLGHPQGRLVHVRSSRGFTLIELLIALAIGGILLLMAAPLYSVWLADNQISNGAQLVADGLRYAQGEAIKRNVQVQLVLDKTTSTGGWTAQLECTGTVLRQGYFAEGADKVQFAPAPAASTTVTFTPLGQIATLKCDGTALPAPFDTVDITSALSGTRALRVLVGGTRTGVKICDPAMTLVNASDPKACPPLNG